MVTFLPLYRDTLCEKGNFFYVISRLQGLLLAYRYVRVCR